MAVQPKVAIVVDWITDFGGAERTLLALSEAFPDAPIYTLFSRRENLSPALQKRTICTSFLQFIPGIFKFYRWLLPLFPFAIRSLNLKQYDFVISVSHCVAKSAPHRKDAIHICYCNTPMRFLWDFTDEYL